MVLRDQVSLDEALTLEGAGLIEVLVGEIEGQARLIDPFSQVGLQGAAVGLGDPRQEGKLDDVSGQATRSICTSTCETARPP